MNIFAGSTLTSTFNSSTSTYSINFNLDIENNEISFNSSTDIFEIETITDLELFKIYTIINTIDIGDTLQAIKAAVTASTDYASLKSGLTSALANV